MRIHGLTPHQWRGAKLVADGDTDKDISTKLHISLDGVDALLARVAERWELDPLKNRRAQITRRLLESEARKPAA